MYLEEVFSLKNKVALVTGAGRSIGQNAALAFAKAGADIAVFSRSGASKTKELVEAEGRKCLDLRCDVTNEAQVEAAMTELMNAYGRIDVVFNNAGICIPKSAFEMTIEEFHQVVDTNLVGEFIVARAAAKRMIEKKIRGSIINMASMSGRVVNLPQQQAAYNASKAAVSQMTKSLAIEWAPYGIRVNALNPGYLENLYEYDDIPEENKKEWKARTPFEGRFCKFSELVPALLYLACDAAGYTTASDVFVDGGYTAV